MSSYFAVTAWVRKGGPQGNHIVYVGARGFTELPLTSYGSKTNALDHARQIREACGMRLSSPSTSRRGRRTR
jgi:hypothetical protein